jgi:hypothetical protein
MGPQLSCRKGNSDTVWQPQTGSSPPAGAPQPPHAPGRLPPAGPPSWRRATRRTAAQRSPLAAGRRTTPPPPSWIGACLQVRQPWQRAWRRCSSARNAVRLSGVGCAMQCTLLQCTHLLCQDSGSARTDRRLLVGLRMSMTCCAAMDRRVGGGGADMGKAKCYRECNPLTPGKLSPGVAAQVTWSAPRHRGLLGVKLPAQRGDDVLDG